MTEFNDNRHSIYKGNKLTVEIYGASHAPEIGVKVDGFNKGDLYDEELLQQFLNRRKAVNTAYSTKRFEPDLPQIISGASSGVLDGNTFYAIVKNTSQKSADYDNLKKIPRPSHADFVAWTKYGNGFDYRGGGKFSGRMTVAMCIAGGICKQLLQKKGISVTAYISQIGKAVGASYKDTEKIEVKDQTFPLIDESFKANMLKEIDDAHQNLDSVGGKIECVVEGLPIGVGEFMFDSIESVISHLVFAVPAIKGIEFGSGFDFCGMNGSVANDQFIINNGVVKTKTNRNGGINGGLSNGMPITFGVAVKPTPSIMKKQRSVNLADMTECDLEIKGRHDACIVVRAVPVIEAVTALALYDLLG